MLISIVLKQSQKAKAMWIKDHLNEIVHGKTLKTSLFNKYVRRIQCTLKFKKILLFSIIMKMFSFQYLAKMVAISYTFCLGFKLSDVFGEIKALILVGLSCIGGFKAE